MRGASPLERRLCLAACLVVAISVSTWTANEWQLGGGDFSTDTVVTLAADGSAEEQEEIVKPYSSYYLSRGFSFYTAKDRHLRFLDPMGNKMPVEVVVTGTQARHDVTFTDSVFDEGKMRYTRPSDISGTANLEDGVWTYQDGMRVAGCENKYSITMLLPPGAEFLSAEPTASAEVNEDGRTQVRFQGTTVDDKQYTFTIRYELPSTSEWEE